MPVFPSAPAGIQVEVIPRWPGRIVGTGGVKVARTAGTAVVSSDIPSLVEVTPANNEGRFVQVWNEDADTSERVELKNLPTKSPSFNELTDVPETFAPTPEGVHDVVSHLLTAGPNVALTYDDTAGTLQVAVPAEGILDVVGSFLTAGANTQLTYDDGANALQVAVPTESIQDAVAGFLVGGTGIALTYNDDAGTLTIDGTGSTMLPARVKGRLSTAGTGAPQDVTMPQLAAMLNLTGSDRLQRFPSGSIMQWGYNDPGAVQPDGSVWVNVVFPVAFNFLTTVVVGAWNHTGSIAPTYYSLPVVYARSATGFTLYWRGDLSRGVANAGPAWIAFGG